MAGSMNRVTLIGNVGADPEIKVLQGGGKVANLSVATSETWRDKQTNEKKEKTDWHRIVVWSEGLVGIVDKFVKKGSKICVEGKLQTRKWKDQSGADRYSTEVVLNGYGAQILLLGDAKGGGGDEDGDRGNTGPRQSSSNGQPSRFGNDDLDDDIPF